MTKCIPSNSASPATANGKSNGGDRNVHGHLDGHVPHCTDHSRVDCSQRQIARPEKIGITLLMAEKLLSI
jgi:hypothetical protein